MPLTAWETTKVELIQAENWWTRKETTLWTDAAILAKWDKALLRVQGELTDVYGVTTVAEWEGGDDGTTCPEDVRQMITLVASELIFRDAEHLDPAFRSQKKQDVDQMMKEYVSGARNLHDNSGNRLSRETIFVHNRKGYTPQADIGQELGEDLEQWDEET